MRTIKNLIENGFAIRGVMVQPTGTNRTEEVSHADEKGVYLTGKTEPNGPYAPESLTVLHIRVKYGSSH